MIECNTLFFFFFFNISIYIYFIFGFEFYCQFIYCLFFSMLTKVS